MDNITITKHPDSGHMTESVSDLIRSILGDKLKRNGEASMVVSGGSTPVPIYRSLSRVTLDWRHIHVLLADERWVPARDPDSNQRLVRENLLVNQAVDADFIFFPTSCENAEDSIASMQARLTEFPGKFDLVILGMGNDGHTASLFPCAPEISRGLSMQEEACLVLTPANAAHRRLSLSMPRLLLAEKILLLIRGDEKFAVLETALQPGSSKELPVRALLHQGIVEVDIHWSP